MKLANEEAPGFIYEVVDSTDETTYWSQGVFLTLESAIDFCLSWDSPSCPPVTESPDLDGRLTLEIRKRELGKAGTYSVAWTKTWVYSFEDDEHWEEEGKS